MEEQNVSVQKVRLKTGQEIALIKLGGYIDQVTTCELEKVFNFILRKKIYYIVVDLSDAEYVGSGGWGVFLSEIRTIRNHGGELKLVGMKPNVYEVFELLELNYILEALNSIEEAFIEFVQKEPSVVV